VTLISRFDFFDINSRIFNLVSKDSGII